MKKTAIILTLCIAALSGCGHVDSVEVDGNMRPVEIESGNDGITENPSYTDYANTNSTAETKSASGSAVTTARIGTANLVKRTGVYSTAAVHTGTPNRNVVSVPKRTASPNAPAATTPHTTAPVRTSTANSASTNKSICTTTAVSTTTTAVTTADQSDNPAFVTNNDITCCVVENGVEIIRENIVIQTIEIDTSGMLNAYAEGRINPKTRIVIKDFDFDGNPDLFIPQEITDINTYGVFRRYEPETGTFNEWEEMSDITGYAETDEENETIIFTITKNEYEYDTRIYSWNGDGQLVPVSRKIQFRINDSESEMWNVYVDYCEYPDGDETIVKREILIFNDVYEIVGSQEIEIEWTLR